MFSFMAIESGVSLFPISSSSCTTQTLEAIEGELSLSAIDN